MCYLYPYKSFFQFIKIILLVLAPFFFGMLFAYRQDIFDFFSNLLSYVADEKEHIIYLKPYEEIHNEKFQNMICPKLDNSQLADIYSQNKDCNTFVMEYTPNGTIIMGYNYKEHAFYYFTNNSIHTKYIHAVALKYMIITHTKWITQICMDEKGNKSLIHNKNIIPFESSSTENESETKKKSDSGGIVSRSGVMAKLKSRSDETKNNNNKDSDKDKDKDKDKDNKKDDDVDTKDGFDIVSLLSNVKFVKLGRASDFSLLKSYLSENKISNNNNNNTSQEIKTNEKLSFADYKKIIRSKSA